MSTNSQNPPFRPLSLKDIADIYEELKAKFPELKEAQDFSKLYLCEPMNPIPPPARKQPKYTVGIDLAKEMDALAIQILSNSILAATPVLTVDDEPELKERSEPLVPSAILERPVLAWRAWHLERGNFSYSLSSISTRGGWSPKETPAAKHQSFRLNPMTQQPENTQSLTHEKSENCNCGYYGLKHFDLETAIGPDWYAHRNTAIGVVKLWGVIHRHKYGYRAEYAYPYAVFLPTHLMGVANAISSIEESYGVEVGVYEVIEALYSKNSRPTHQPKLFYPDTSELPWAKPIDATLGPWPLGIEPRPLLFSRRYLFTVGGPMERFQISLGLYRQPRWIQKDPSPWPPA